MEYTDGASLGEASPHSFAMNDQLPLAGIRVLDLSRVLAGPLCGQILANLGADVVKVERPGLGDETRAWGPPFLPPAPGESKPGPSAYYLSINRGKRSLALDLARPEAREVVDGLLSKADILLENFLPETLAKFGLLPERLAALHPQLVRVSISGYGRTGPLADTPGYDLAIQASSGLMAITGEADGAPMKVGVAITDVVTALYATTAALAGLVRRGRLGAGVGYDLSLADCTLSALVNVAQASLLTGRAPQRFGNAHPQIVPYESFATSDGALVVAVGNDAQWQRFCAALDHREWAADPRFATNPSRVIHREELIPLILAVLKLRSTEEWKARFTAADVPHAPVQSLDQVFASPQVAARGMLREVTDSAGRSYRAVGSPLISPELPQAPTQPAPEIGEQSDEILHEWLGYDPARIAALRSSGVISGPTSQN